MDGAMWVPNTMTSTLARIDLETEEVKIYQLDLPPGSFSDDVAKGTDGLYYISATISNVISVFDPKTGKIVENIPVPGLTPGGPGAPFTIVNGDGDDLWTNGILGNDIIKFNVKTRAFTLYPVPTPLAGPDVTILGPNGSVWFSEMTGNKIGTLDPVTGAITEYPLPNAIGTAFDIQWNGQTGPNAAMIVADIVGNKILRFDLNTKTFTQNLTIPTLASAPCATGFANGTVFVGELGGGNVAMVPDHNLPSRLTA